jgi:hypothetical protein
MMIKLFLKAKHWQLFFLMVGVPIIGYMFFVIQLINSFEMQTSTSGTMMTPEGVIEMMRPFFLFMMFPFLIQFGWFYSLGKGVQKYVNPLLRIKSSLFTFTSVFPLLYVFAAFTLMDGILENAALDQNYEPPLSLLLLLPLNFITMGCMFYNFYFIARTLKTAELLRVVKFSDYAGEFFLMWFHFIGVWIVQPKVNQMQAHIPGDLLNELHD